MSFGIHWDTIYVHGKAYRLFSYPLQQYLEQDKNAPVLFTFEPHPYTATWEIEDNKLFLTDFKGGSMVSSDGKAFAGYREYFMQDLFPNQDKVFASWYTGTLCIGTGWKKDNASVHDSLLPQYEVYIEIRQGLVVNVSDIQEL